MGSNPKTSYVSTGFKQTHIMQIRTGFPTVGEKVTNKRREQAKGKPCELESEVSVQRHCFIAIRVNICTYVYTYVRMHACSHCVYICTVLHMCILALPSEGA